MLGPYTANKDGSISYKGNKLFLAIQNIQSVEVPIEEIEDRVNQFAKDNMWGHIAKINHQVNISTNEFFNNLGALFTPLPLTTRMISSPGAVYGKEAINYTTDTCPITLKWFDLQNTAFLSESSQIYLELAIIQNGVDQVYSIYNSFRKEHADATHLSEFHHIEYEGKINQTQNEEIILNLIKKIITDLLEKNRKDMAYFLDEEKLKELKNFADNIHNVPRRTFKEVLELLYNDTGNEKYKEFTLKNFGSWEEIKITEILGNMVVIREFPLLEVPFYHALVDGKEPKVASNSDFIWPSYRETVGSGHRVRSKEELNKKADIFQLPKEDYSPYLQTRELNNYRETSGFGLGWERLLQGLLETPFIWSACQFPRVDITLKP
ncbi:MAG: asparagine--tRNA ligase [Candidatus Pacearchaeota archaeon]|nr:asparagine--tRNA ligase [Candidatus Pacearchaeota archaeon]